LRSGGWRREKIVDANCTALLPRSLGLELSLVGVFEVSF
jgi:hypothetical protein